MNDGKTARVIPFPVGAEEAPTTDADLIASCAAGDMGALAALFDRHGDGVYRFLQRLGAGDSAEDLTQTTFLEARRAAPSYGGRASGRTWLLGIAANVSRRHLKKLARRRKLCVAIEHHPRPSHHQGDAEQHLLLVRIAESMATLPAREREVFAMCDLEQIPCVEAAELLGVPVGTVYRRLHHARRALRAALGGDS